MVVVHGKKFLSEERLPYDVLGMEVVPKQTFKKWSKGPVTKPLNPRGQCPECGKWTTALYLHMVCSHNWTGDQVAKLKAELKKNDDKTPVKVDGRYWCKNCGVGYISTFALYGHMASCWKKLKKRKRKKKGKKNEIEYYPQPKQLPFRPAVLPPLPDQLSETVRGAVLCPVPRCEGRFANHDSLSYHCMIEHSELGAAGTPQNFAIRQYRFETKEEYKEWLCRRCEETCTSFSTKTSMWSGYAMYRCNRAGTFKTSSSIRVGTTTKKSQSHCSAFLRISEYNDGSIDVTCCFGHIFHELDPTALRLNERQCGVIQSLLEKKMFLSDICAKMKAEYPPTNRLHYTTANDVRNLALRLGLPIRLKAKIALKNNKPSDTRDPDDEEIEVVEDEPDQDTADGDEHAAEGEESEEEIVVTDDELGLELDVDDKIVEGEEVTMEGEEVAMEHPLDGDEEEDDGDEVAMEHHLDGDEEEGDGDEVDMEHHLNEEEEGAVMDEDDPEYEEPDGMEAESKPASSVEAEPKPASCVEAEPKPKSSMEAESKPLSSATTSTESDSRPGRARRAPRRFAFD